MIIKFVSGCGFIQQAILAALLFARVLGQAPETMSLHSVRMRHCVESENPTPCLNVRLPLVLSADGLECFCPCKEAIRSWVAVRVNSISLSGPGVVFAVGPGEYVGRGANPDVSVFPEIGYRQPVSVPLRIGAYLPFEIPRRLQVVKLVGLCLKTSTLIRRFRLVALGK